jgi:hypothetical protein
VDRYRDPTLFQAASIVKNSNYVKLPGKARTLATTSRLWLGDDHILLVKSTRIVEDYRRFYFPDVQAIVLRRTMPFHYGWAAFLFVIALIVARISGSLPATLILLAASAAYLWFRGPACVCHLYTAVRRERLPSLHRWRTAERVLETLRARIEEHQGTLVSVPEIMAATSAPILSQPPPLPAAALQAGSPIPHFVLFSVLLMSAALAGYALLEPDGWAPRAAAPASYIEFLTFVPALMSQTGRRVSRELKALTWASVARWAAVQLPAWVVQYKAAIVDRTTRDLSPWTVPLGHGWIGWLHFVSLLIIGVAGMWFTMANARAAAYASGESRT